MNDFRPLAERMRPRRLEDYVGQEHLVGENGVIRQMLTSGQITPFILWGPPGVGKTTLARIVAQSLEREFYVLSAVTAGVKDVREVLDEAKSFKLFAKTTPVLFIDEIHRFNKSQQDSLLGAVERGEVALIGATTENPSFEVISPLLSRCQVYTLKSLEREALQKLAQRAIQEDELLKKVNFEFVEDDAFYLFAAGDGRKLLNILELLYNARTGDAVQVTNALVQRLLQQRAPRYDKHGEMHYDCISAFIKSVRGSDPQAAVYWMARMLAAGEDPVFVARRLIILAAEDIGLANPNALLIANAAMSAVQNIGMPEARIVLSEAALYLASSEKSNSAYRAINDALTFVSEETPHDVPLHLRNAPTKLMKDMGYSDGYKYAHDYPRHFVQLEFLPAGMEGTVFYHPQDNSREREMATSLKQRWGDKYKLEQE